MKIKEINTVFDERHVRQGTCIVLPTPILTRAERKFAKGVGPSIIKNGEKKERPGAMETFKAVFLYSTLTSVFIGAIICHFDIEIDWLYGSFVTTGCSLGFALGYIWFGLIFK